MQYWHVFPALEEYTMTQLYNVLLRGRDGIESKKADGSGGQTRDIFRGRGPNRSRTYN